MGYYLPDNFGADWLWKSNTLVPGTVDSVQPVRNSGYPIPFFDFVLGGNRKTDEIESVFGREKRQKPPFGFRFTTLIVVVVFTRAGHFFVFLWVI